MVDFVLKILMKLTKKIQRMAKNCMSQKMRDVLTCAKSIFRFFRFFIFLDMVDFVLIIISELGTLTTTSSTLCEPDSETQTSDTR